MQLVLIVIHLMSVTALIALILLQRSEGGALGIGGGGAGNLFSVRGAGNALTKATAIFALVFFLTSIGLTVIATQDKKSGNIIEKIIGTKPTAETEPQMGSQTGDDQAVAPLPLDANGGAVGDSDKADVSKPAETPPDTSTTAKPNRTPDSPVTPQDPQAPISE